MFAGKSCTTELRSRNLQARHAAYAYYVIDNVLDVNAIQRDTAIAVGGVGTLTPSCRLDRRFMSLRGEAG